MRLKVRAFADGALLFEEEATIRKTGQLTEMSQRHLRRLRPFPIHMLEIEFLDIPDINQRFLRFGTDPSVMAQPQKVHLPI